MSCIAFLICVLSYGQDTIKDLNFIIVIDEEVAVGDIMRVAIEDESGNLYKLRYYPGNLSINLSDYQKLISDKKTQTLLLSFIFYKDDDTIYNRRFYEIKIKQDFLEDFYNILKIYNLDEKKYRKMFNTYIKKKKSKYVYQIKSSKRTTLVTSNE